MRISDWSSDVCSSDLQPQAALNHAILAIRDLPPEDKAIWREQFDHYVFENDDSVTDHIPEKARSILARLTPESAGRLRAFLFRTLSRCTRLKRSSASSSRAAAPRAGWRGPRSPPRRARRAHFVARKRFRRG